MKILAIAAVSAATLLSATYDVQAREGGCIKYGLGGAVLGHFAGGHGMAGAAAGCALGAYKRNRAEDRYRGYETGSIRRHDDYGRVRSRGDYNDY